MGLTAFEFNDKWRAFRQDGYFGLSIDHPEVIRYLDREVLPQCAEIPGFRFSQIKTKFSSVRFYAKRISPGYQRAVEDRIKEILENDDTYTNPYFTPENNA